MGKSKIKWTEYTWSPIVGCPGPIISEGCRNCWARQLHNQRHKAYLDGKKLPSMYAKPFEKIQFFKERLFQPTKWKKPREIFVCPQGDLFHEQVKFAWIDKILSVTELAPQHTYYLLTKRADGLLKYSEHIGGFQYFPNVCVGLTICTQAEADEKLPIFFNTPAARRFLSIEPMLEGIYLRLPMSALPSDCGHIDWVVVGAESGKSAGPCNELWIYDIIKQCKTAGVSCFVKQIHVPSADGNSFRLSKDMAEWPEYLQRQEKNIKTKGKDYGKG